MTDDDELKIPDAEIEEEKEIDPIDDLVPLIVADADGEVVDDDSDEVLATESFSPVEGAETPGEFDPEDPDAYLYNPPPVKYADSADEDEAGWTSEEEF